MTQIKNVLIWIGVIIFYLFMQLLVPGILDMLNIANIYVSNITLLLSELLITGALIYYYKNDFKKDCYDLNKNFKHKIGSVFKIWLIGLVIMIFSNNIINIISKTEMASNESVNRIVLENLTIYAIPVMVIFGPICEEIIFRLSFKKIFKNNYLFIILSGLVFGLSHVIGTSGLELLYLIPYGALGSAFAYMYVKNKNILCPIMAHMMHNLLCIVLIMFL